MVNAILLEYAKKQALELLKSTIQTVLTVENVDNVYDTTLDTTKQAGMTLLDRWPTLADSFGKVCDKAKEGTHVAELVVDAVNRVLLGPLPGAMPGQVDPNLPVELSSIGTALSDLQYA